MKKAFVSVLLAVGLLSACSNQNIETITTASRFFLFFLIDYHLP